ncbi:Coactosin like protein [Verticillium longisporum]|uniref:Coactosin like protein n=1 Tax=Verticillium longisporum TaxID=100787 RepID=A0A8I3AWY5_VERLO|nr:Coactosin like protein [Verticillium longisporum]
MSGLSSPEVAAAYDAVRSDKDDITWLLVANPSPTSKDLTLTKTGTTKTGTGDVTALAAELQDDQVQYGYVRVEYANDSESTRVKFALIVWIGENTKVMRKARVSIEAGEVRRVLAHHSIQVNASDKSDLDLQDIVKRLRKAGGADYNGGRG